MTGGQILGSGDQGPRHHLAASRHIAVYREGLLGNDGVQRLSRSGPLMPRPGSTAIVGIAKTDVNTSRDRLDSLKKLWFSPEGRSERIARSLAALERDVRIHLTSQEWKQIAEDPDVEDQF
jgi:hypothetical protein